MKRYLILAFMIFTGMARAQLFEYNIALFKPTAGDVAFNSPTSNGVDGNVGSFTHADNINVAPDNPYWTVDFQGTFDLTRIEIVDRIGCCDPNRLNGSEISILDINGNLIGTKILVDGLLSPSPDTATGTLTFNNGGAGWTGAASVRIDGYNQYFQFTEFRAIALLPRQPLNVAANGVITASDLIWEGQSAGSLIDNNPLTAAHPLGDVGATQGFTFTVNLLGRYSFERLEIVNRADCCPERLTNYRVTLHNDDGSGSPGPPVWTAVVRSDGSDSGMGGVDVLEASLDGAGTFAGQYLRVENLSGAAYNPQIAEIRALTFDDPAPNLAAGKPVTCYDTTDTAVDTWAGFPSGNLTDGQNGTFSHPLQQFSSGYYFEVDLEAPVSIGLLTVLGRLDGCCPDRLSDARLQILSETKAVVFEQVLAGQVVNPIVVRPGSPVTGRYVRIINENGADYGPQIGEIAVFAPVTAPPSYFFNITGVTVNAAAGTGSLTFTSAAGETYAIFGSNDLSAWTEVVTGIASGGATTTRAFTDAALTGAKRRFYEVRRLP